MFLSRLTHRILVPCIQYASRTSIRTASTITGQSGRVYLQREVLQHHREDPKLSISKAECVYMANISHALAFCLTSSTRSQDQFFVSKRVSKYFYDRSLSLAADFPASRRLRMHVDCNEEESVLVYPYYRSDLLALWQEDPDMSEAVCKIILRRIGEAIQELHSKDWIHVGTTLCQFTYNPYSRDLN
jgi:serine/threonine protein kinase